MRLGPGWVRLDQVSVHLGVRVLHPHGLCECGVVRGALEVVQVERLFTLTEVQAGTFHHGEPEGGMTSLTFSCAPISIMLFCINC